MSRFAPTTRSYGKTAQMQETVQLSGIIVTETLKAILLQVHMVGDRDIPEHLRKDVWFPISQVPKTLRQSHVSDEKDILHVSAWIWGRKVEDDWKGKDPSLSSPPSQVDEEQSLEDDDPFFDEEAPPW